MRSRDACPECLAARRRAWRQAVALGVAASMVLAVAIAVFASNWVNPLPGPAWEVECMHRAYAPNVAQYLPQAYLDSIRRSVERRTSCSGVSLEEMLNGCEKYVARREADAEQTRALCLANSTEAARRARRVALGTVVSVFVALVVGLAIRIARLPIVHRASASPRTPYRGTHGCELHGG